MINLAQIIFFLLIVKPFMAFFIGLRVYGRKNIPNKYPFILVANHSSHLDAIALLGLFPLKTLKNVRPVAAFDYFETNKLRSFFAHTFFNIISIRRKDLSKHEDPLLPLEKALDNGQSLIFFPEGTRSLTGEIGQFHSGVIHLLERKPEIPLVPVYLSNMARTLPKGETIPVPFFCDLHIGGVISLRGTRGEMLKAIRDALILLQEGEDSHA
jgi:1-acyl-sn-glycerol-3-phosphate acyltransferase